MSPLDDVGNLISSTLSGVWAPVILSLFVYAMLVILFPSVFQFIRCRHFSNALQDLAKRRSEMNTLSSTEPL
jgi:ABC-type transport system involved in multi-copper enzyme maturation permease subunit